MIKKINLKITALICTLVLAVVAIVALPAVFRAQASVTFGEINLSEEYLYGSQFIVPTQSVTVNGVQESTVSVLEFPDGTATRKTVVNLDMDGKYKLRYSTAIEGKVYNKEYTFTVKLPSVVYGKTTTAEYGERTMTFQGRNKQFSHTREGLYVRLGQGDTLRFSSLIDMTDCNTFESVISFTVLPDVLGVVDFESVDIRLTDSQNPDVWLNTNVSAADLALEINAYFLVNGNNQSPSGYAHDLDTMFVGRVGTNQLHPFNGLYYFPNAEWDKNNRYEDFDLHQTVAMYYDSAENAVYNNGRKDGNKKLVADLDNPKHFSESWNGFPSGKAYLTVTADKYTSATANFLITAVKDNDLSKAFFEDEDAPEITVDTPYDAMPNALVNRSYQIPSATAFDDYLGEVELKTSVWYNYSSPSAVMVDIKDGKFTPKRKGNYSIVYETSDRTGNKAKKVLSLKAVDQIEPVSVTLPNDKITTSEAGREVSLPVAQTSGGSGDKKVIISVTSSEGTVIVENGKFTPEKSGDYAVLYTAIDYIGNTAQTGYQITVSNATKPVFNDIPALPQAFVSGSKYILPALYADDYTSGSLIRRKASLQVTDANGTKTVADGAEITPTVNKNGDKVKVSYICGTAKYEVEIPAIFAYENESGRMRLKVENYLVGEGFTLDKQTDYTVVSATSSNGKWTFANSLVAQNFNLTIGSVNNKSVFDAILITLTDTQDLSQSLSARIVRDGEIARLEILGKTYPLSSAFDGDRFAISYANGQFKVDETTVKLEGFGGFSSNKVWLSVQTENAFVGAEYLVYDVCGQGIKNSSNDRTAPVIAILGDWGGTKSFGKLITLPVAVAGDVLDPNIKFVMTVTDPNGNPVKTENGVTLDGVNPTEEYSFEASVYGRYLVNYSAIDTFNDNEQPFQYAINVLDEIAPTVSLKQDFVSSAKVGDTVVIPEFTIKDNLSANEDIVVIRQVFTPSGSVMYVPASSNSIKCSSAGEYLFKIMVVDTAGNITVVEKTVTVKEA